MNNYVKFIITAMAAFFMLIGTANASPISVNDVVIQETGGDYIIVVSLDNANSTSGVFTELEVEIEELGTSKNLGVVKVDSNQTQVFTYTLDEVTDSFDSLKKGEAYTLTVTTDSNSESKSFLFGSAKTTEGLTLILEEVEVNEDEVTNVDTLQVLNGERIKVDLRFTAQESFDDARIMVFVEGYEHSPIVDSTEIFSVVEGKTYIKTLSVDLPSDMDNEQDYKLRIAGANDLSGLTYKDYTLYVDTDRHRVDVLDLVMTPSSGVEPGQNIIANVRMKNRGQKEQDSVKVIVAIPELGVSESSYVSNLNKDEVATSDDMLLYIPEEAQAKEYNVQVTLAYNDGYTETSDSYSLNVLSPKLVEERNLLVSFKNNVDLKAGEGTSFDIIIANPNENSKPISIGALDNAWADVTVSPSLSMVQAGADATYTVTVTPKSAVEGEKSLALVVKEGAVTVSSLDVSTYVEPSEDVNWVNVVLAVLLVIAIIVLLALIVAIARRKHEDEDEVTSSNEEYY